VITSGDLPPNPTELLGSKKMQLVLEKLKEISDVVVLDSPPVLPVADTANLATSVDGVVIVLQPGKTTLTAALEAVEQLHRVKANIIGVILNNVNLKNSPYHYIYRKTYRSYGYGNE
jgi:capsular exopolysaccharide synthesis family protein